MYNSKGDVIFQTPEKQNLKRSDTKIYLEELKFSFVVVRMQKTPKSQPRNKVKARHQ